MKIIQQKLKIHDYYCLLEFNSIRIGENIAFDIFIKKENDYIIIIEAGTLITEALYTKLQNQPTLHIFKKDKDKVGLSFINIKDYIRYNIQNYERRIGYIYELNDILFDNYLHNPHNKIDLNCANMILESILFLIENDKQFLKNTMPFFVNKHSLANHSLHVAIYAMNLANTLNFKPREMMQLALSALFHDLGLKKIDEDLIQKSTKLDITDLEEVQKHVLFSVEIIKSNQIHDPYVIEAIMQHHEQYDGNGYPNGLYSSEIGQFATILSICDVFDALTNDRPHRKQFSSFEAIKKMLKDESMTNKFNHTCLKKLLKSL